LLQGPKSVLLVLDAKSGHSSLDDIDPSFSNMLRTFYSDKAPEENTSGFPDNIMKIFLIHRHIADKILTGTGKTLDELQERIDRRLKPRSFVIDNKEISITLELDHQELSIPNVAGLVEGSDPVLKDETIIYMAHFDHIGKDGRGNVYNGADDNASGSVALLEMAEAFSDMHTGFYYLWMPSLY